MKLFFRFVILALLSFISVISFAQQNTLAFGLNITHFNDWKKGQFFNFFNPEVGFSKQLNEKFNISTSLDVFYGEAPKLKEVKVGTVTSRLIFSNNYLLEYKSNGFFGGIGPTIRFRNERKIKYFYPQPDRYFEIVFEPNPLSFDFGGGVKTGYNFSITKRSLLSLKLTYRFYNKGGNPVSLGVSYGLTWD